MNLPLFEKITFHKIDTYHIEQVCKETDLGSAPAYIELASLDVNRFLVNLETVLEQLDIHPLFPYPIYIITDQVKDHHLFPILKSTDELPRFYNRKLSSLKKTSSSHKNNALFCKLRSSNLYKKHQLIKNFALKHKLIHQNCTQISFYKKVLDGYKGTHGR